MTKKPPTAKEAAEKVVKNTRRKTRQFFLRKSFSTTLSSMVSASRRFSLAFPSSSDLSRWVAETLKPHSTNVLGPMAGKVSFGF